MTAASPQAPLERLAAGRLAAGIFARHGVDFGTAQRAGGWTNMTWLAGGLALRLSTQAGRENIRREVRLAALLPPEVGYPLNVETGVVDGYEFSLSKQVPGQCLGDAWDGLSWPERIAALRGMWAKAQAVHRVGAAEAGSLVGRRAWFNSDDPAEAAAGLARLAGQGLITPAQARILGAALGRFWRALSDAPCVLVHGDLTRDNVMWHAGEIVSLMDFEFALIAPPHLDLNTLLKCAYTPEDEAAPCSGADRVGRQQLRAAAAELAHPLLAQPGGKELFFGYAILLDLWLLETWLAHPEGEGPLETWDPYRRLLSLADGQGGHLAELLRP